MYEETTVIYADMMFFINFLIDFLCLAAAGRVCARGGKVFRFISAAVAAALYTFVPFIFGRNTIIIFALNIAAAYGVTLLAFGSAGFKRDIITAFSFFISEAIIGGIVTAIYGGAQGYYGLGYVDIGFLPLLGIVALSALAALVYGSLFASRSKVLSANVWIYCGAEIIKLKLLTDSGNLVTEPFSGLPVIIVSAAALPFPFDSPESEAFPLPIRAIPFRTSAGAGCFFGFKPEKAEIRQMGRPPKKIEAYIGVDTGNTDYSGYDGLLPTALL